MSTFNVGDRVRIIDNTKSYYHTVSGSTGTVISITDRWVSVLFDRETLYDPNDLELFEFDILAGHLEVIKPTVQMPESFVNADHYDTRDMMFDLLDLPEFRAMLRANYDTSVDGDDLLYHVRYALVDNLNSAELANFKYFVRERLGWEDPAIAAKRKRINELKEELSRLEQEIESR